MSCRAGKRFDWHGDGKVSHLTCCRGDHGPEVPHRWVTDERGTAIVIEWNDDRRRVGLADMNGIRTTLAKVQEAPDDQVALAILGYLADRPGVAEMLLADLPLVLR